MSISILPASLEDVPALVDLGMRAFKDDPFNKRTFNQDTATPEQIAQYRAWRIGMSTNRQKGPGKYYFKAIDDATGAIVGLAGLYSPEGFDVKSTWESPLPVPDFVEQSAQDEFRVRQTAAQAKWLGERKDVWYVQSMAVSPDYWGRGIAKKLLRRGLEEVDKTGQDIYLEATAAATALYTSCGFETLEKLEMWDGELVMTAMIRRHRMV